MKDKISITVDQRLMNFIDMVRGDVPRSKFIESNLQDKLGLFEAVWLFSSELNKISKKEWLLAHVSQPVGKPLHKHEGFIDVSRGMIDFYNPEMERLFSVDKKDIKGLKVGYDKEFRRLMHSRGLNPPLYFKFGDEKLYLFSRPLGKTIFRGDNQTLLQFLS